MKKQSVKIIVDVIMTVILMLLMAFELIGRTAHEWLGVGMFVMFVSHHILNRKWTSHLLKGKYTPIRIFQTLLAVLVLVCILCSMVSGIVLSRYVFSFLPIEGGRSWARTLHMIGAYWGFVFMSLHLGIHWNMMMGMAGKAAGNPSALRTWILRILGAAYGTVQEPGNQSEDGQGKEGGTGQQEPAKTDFFAMDTYMTFTAYGDNAEAALSQAEEEICRLEGEWSVTDEGSEIWQVNHSGGETVTLSSETAQIVRFALDMAEQTDGALEPTIYPVLSAWGFTTDENRIPGGEELQSLLENTGYEKVELDGSQITLPSGMELDLGAVGKGYAGDLAAELLETEGITSALLDIGGNIQAVGSRPDGSDWRLGLQSPYGEGTVGVLSVSDCAVVTSGNYERYFIGSDGKEYGHIIDPDTGYPVDNGLASVTIIADEGKIGDALSTSMFVKGLEGAEDYWRSNQDFEMIIITEDGQIYLTEGAGERFELSESFGNMEVHVISADGE